MQQNRRENDGVGAEEIEILFSEIYKLFIPYKRCNRCPKFKKNLRQCERVDAINSFITKMVDEGRAMIIKSPPPGRSQNSN